MPHLSRSHWKWIPYAQYYGTAQSVIYLATTFRNCTIRQLATDSSQPIVEYMMHNSTTSGSAFELDPVVFNVAVVCTSVVWLVSCVLWVRVQSDILVLIWLVYSFGMLVLITIWGVKTQLLIKLTSRTFWPWGICQLLRRRNLIKQLTKTSVSKCPASNFNSQLCCCSLIGYTSISSTQLWVSTTSQGMLALWDCLYTSDFRHEESMLYLWLCGGCNGSCWWRQMQWI